MIKTLPAYATDPLVPIRRRAKRFLRESAGKGFVCFTSDFGEALVSLTDTPRIEVPHGKKITPEMGSRIRELVDEDDFIFAAGHYFFTRDTDAITVKIALSEILI